MSKMKKIAKGLPPRLPDEPNNIIITKADVGRRIIYVDKERHREGLLVNWNERHAFVRFPEGDTMAFEPRFLRFASEPWLPQVADFIVLFVGHWQWKRMINGSGSMVPDHFIEEIAAGRDESVNIVQHLIGRLTPRRLALPNDHDSGGPCS